LGYIIGKIVDYADQNYEFSRFSLAKLKFMLELIFWNAAEFLLFAVVFLCLGKGTEFFVSAGVLMGIRIFSGGFHLKNFTYCVIFSLAFFIMVIMVLPAVDITNGLMEILLAASVLIVAVLAPVSKRNTAHSLKSMYIFKFISIVIALIYTVWLLYNKNSPYAAICTWTIFMQSFQLIIGKGLLLYEKSKT